MIRFTSTRRRVLLALPALSAAALLIVGVGAPVNASAAVTPRTGVASPAALGEVFQGARAMTAPKSHAVGADALRPHQSFVPCTFNGASTTVANVTPGETIAVNCSGFLANEEVVLGESSPLNLVVDNAQGVNEIDGNDVDVVNSNGSGDVITNFVVPNPFKAPDPAAACPSTQIQVNSGLGECVLIVTDADLNVGGANLDYSGEPTAQPAGYWEGASDGGIFSFGEPFEGSEGGKPLVKPIVGMAFDPDTGGYWEVASDGGIFAFGGAPFEGSMGGHPLAAPIVGMAFDPNTGGYWEVASDGGIFAFGGAPFDGSMGGQPLTKPIVGIAADSFTGGYWEVASDGGIFAFGGAPFDGSMGNKPLDKPIVGMALDPSSGGYWEVASDGGIFAFGGATFLGSMGNKFLVKPIVGMAVDPFTGGYWEVASDGGLFSFGAPFQGSEGGTPLAKPVVAMAPALLD